LAAGQNQWLGGATCDVYPAQEPFSGYYQRNMAQAAVAFWETWTVNLRCTGDIDGNSFSFAALTIAGRQSSTNCQARPGHRQSLRVLPMFGSFFDTTATDELADWIVAEVKRSLPSGFAPGMKNIADRAEKLNVSIAQRTGEFMKTTPRLNIYKKARLAARVREGMSAHGYPEPFVKSFSYDLIARLRGVSKARKP
jgi:hypothetical protein